MAADLQLENSEVRDGQRKVMICYFLHDWLLGEGLERAPRCRTVCESGRYDSRHVNSVLGSDLNAHVENGASRTGLVERVPVTACQAIWIV